MNIILRSSQPDDMPFLREMLYEAVFWRDKANRPSFEEGLSMPSVSKVLDDWMQREGDAAVVAVADSRPVGAAWYRYWEESDDMRGYYDDDVPVLVIGVHEDFRHKKIGTKMIEWLVKYAAKQSIDKISLCVSKDNYAINLYKQQGFTEEVDIGDSFVMVRDVSKTI